MKKTLFFVMIIAVLTAGCKKKEETTSSTSLNYYDTDPINMVFQDTHKIAVESDYDITYEILGTSTIRVLRFERPGVLKALNVGTDKVKISNGHEEMTVDVIVDLFTEPTFEFGCSTNRIKELYGNPSMSKYVGTNQDTLCYVYSGNASTNYMYSPTCYHMDFYFHNSSYVLSQLFIKNNIDVPLENYLNDNFDYLYTIQNYYFDNNITHDSVPAMVYQNKANDEIRCVKYEHANEYDDISLIYLEVENETIK